MILIALDDRVVGSLWSILTRQREVADEGEGEGRRKNGGRRKGVGECICQCKSSRSQGEVVGEGKVTHCRLTRTQITRDQSKPAQGLW
jgi:hypothetical protein